MSDWFAASPPLSRDISLSRSQKLRQCLDTALNEVQSLKRILKSRPITEAPAVTACHQQPASVSTTTTTSKTLTDNSCQTDESDARFNATSSTPMSTASKMFSNSLFRDDGKDDDQLQESEPSSPDNVHQNQSPLVWRAFVHASPAPAAAAKHLDGLWDGSLPTAHESDGQDDSDLKRIDQASHPLASTFSFDGAAKAHRRAAKDRVTMTPMASPLSVAPAPLSPFMISSMGANGAEAESMMRGL